MGGIIVKGLMILLEILIGLFVLFRIISGQATGGDYIWLVCDIVTVIVHWRTAK